MLLFYSNDSGVTNLCYLDPSIMGVEQIKRSNTKLWRAKNFPLSIRN